MALIIDGNAVYEIDDECQAMKNRTEEQERKEARIDEQQNRPD